MDTSMTGLTRAINQVGTSFEEYKRVNDERLEAVKSGKDSLAGELQQKLGRIEGDISKWSAIKSEIEIEQKLMRERIEELESKRSQPGKTAQQKIKDEYKESFTEWVRMKGASPAHEQRLIDLAKKDVTVGTGSAGGFAVPEEIAREIERMEAKFSPVRRLVKVVKVGSSDYKELVGIRGATSGWVGETATRTATNTPALREVTPTHGELYAYPQTSEWSLDDIYFDVEAWLAEAVGEEFAIAEGDAVIRGNGTSKPTGMLNSAPTAVADVFPPTRAAAVYEFVANVDPAFAILPDRLIDLVYRLNSAYRSGATWTMNSVTTGSVRKLKDTQNQYLWAPGLVAGQPDSLLG
jgi:HK97 family phage major capsid protein